MSYDELKKKYPDLNWQEAEEVCPEDLEAASDAVDALVLTQKARELQKKNPYGDLETILLEMTGFVELSIEDKRIYVAELTILANNYCWHAEFMPKGKFYGLKNVIRK